MSELEQAHEILSTALDQHKPSLVVCCFSGGYDSMVTTHLVTRWQRSHAQSTNVLTVAVDTLISADGWREFVTSSSKQIGVRRFEIWANPTLTEWKKDVTERGFVYRKTQHKIYFYYLKQRVFRAVQANYKKHKHDRIMFVTGVRRAESSDRANAPLVEVKGAGVYVNPLVYWSDEQLHQYRIDNELPDNPFYDTFGNSGDCLCNWHSRISREAVRQHAPAVYKIVAPLDTACRERFGYGYDDEPQAWRIAEINGQMRLFEWDTDDTPNLCAGCRKLDPKNDALADVMLQRMEW